MKKLFLSLVLLTLIISLNAQSLFGGDSVSDSKNQAATTIENLQSNFDSLIYFDSYEPTPYTYANVPEFLQQLRRFETIFIGAVPLSVFVANTVFSIVSVNAEPEDEMRNKGILIGSVVGTSLAISVVDIIIHNKKKKDQQKLIRVLNEEDEVDDIPAILSENPKQTEPTENSGQAEQVENSEIPEQAENPIQESTEQAE